MVESKSYIGKLVEVKMDRPMGSKHPKYGFIYPVNYGYVPKNVQQELSEFLSIPLAEVYGVVTFYSRFSLEPQGKYKISVCLGTACYVKGSQKIMDRLTDRLKIGPGQTTQDGLFTIEETRCVGACGLAPVFTINNEVYGKATVQKLDKVLDELIQAENNN